MNRSLFLRAALGLLASLAFVTPSQAGTTYITSVTESFSVLAPSSANTISSLTLTYTGLDGISSITQSATGITNGFIFVSPGVSNGAESITLSYSPSVAYVSGAVTFNTITTTNNTMMLATLIPLPTITVTASGSNTITQMPLHFTVLETITVPEPHSMALLGIGMTSFLAFRRFFKRNAVV
jgi:hypothetical protein